MDAASRSGIKFYLEVIPKRTKKALDFLSHQAWLNKSDWYLAGGTALALHAGHRKSIDLDFFTQRPHFRNVSLLNRLKKSGDLSIDLNKNDTIFATLFGAKISFIAYPFFVPKQDFLKYGSVKVLGMKDIGVMKIIAISQRGRKRDFFDLYWCAHNVEQLEDIIRRLKAQYPSVAHDYHHILKSLMYFEDAETDPNPEIYFQVSWDSVKNFFSKEVPLVFKHLIKLF